MRATLPSIFYAKPLIPVLIQAIIIVYVFQCVRVTRVGNDLKRFDLKAIYIYEH